MSFAVFIGSFPISTISHTPPLPPHRCSFPCYLSLSPLQILPIHTCLWQLSCFRGNVLLAPWTSTLNTDAHPPCSMLLDETVKNTVSCLYPPENIKKKNLQQPQFNLQNCFLFLFKRYPSITSESSLQDVPYEATSATIRICAPSHFAMYVFIPWPTTPTPVLRRFWDRLFQLRWCYPSGYVFPEHGRCGVQYLVCTAVFVFALLGVLLLMFHTYCYCT